MHGRGTGLEMGKPATCTELITLPIMMAARAARWLTLRLARAEGLVSLGPVVANRQLEIIQVLHVEEAVAAWANGRRPIVT